LPRAAHTYALPGNSTYWEFFMSSKRLALVVLTASVAFSAPLWAADPTAAQIYEAARTGHLAQAQQMVDQVLKDHPNNAKAHYVAAEVYAREGNYGVARSQLQQAETIDPSGSYANPASIQELKSEIATQGRTTSAPAGTYLERVPARESHFPLFTILIVIAAIGVLWMVFRRRSYSAPYGDAMPSALGPRPYGPGGGYAPGYGPGYGAPPMGGGGIGSGIAGGLASGLAVGAGVVAGEELAHHFLDGNERREVVAAPPEEPAQNSDMGGNDFGVNDPGSWDDSGSGGDGGGGGGGDDWT
jgi:hypothetical protein